MRTPLFPAPVARRCPAWGKLLILLAIALRGAAVRAQLGQLRKTFSIYVGEMAFDPQRPLLYVSQRLGSEVNVIDIDSLAIVKTISTPAQPYGLALSADGGKLYVTQPK